MLKELSVSRKTGFLFFVTGLIIALFVTEIWMRNFLVMSDSANSLMNESWYRKHWSCNVYQYRDYAVQKRVPEGTKRILVLGDSFAAGHGIDRLEDTFPQILARKLPPGFTVNTIAKPGFDTPGEWKALNRYPVEPDILILSYVYNDVDYLVTDRSFKTRTSAPVRFFISNYHVASFLFRHLWTPVMSQSNRYASALSSTYKTPDLWKKQEQLLHDFVNYAKDKQCRLVLIVWPNMANVSYFTDDLSKVTSFFSGQGIDVIDLSSHLKGRNRSELCVNRFDNHPNERVHALAGELLYETCMGKGSQEIVLPRESITL